MINYVSGNILESDCEMLVNPVNTVGVPGKGLALQFAHKFPAATNTYKKSNNQIGQILVVPEQGKLIAFFPTKEHWRNPSKLEWIRDGLITLCSVVNELDVNGVAIPPLGCGLGGLLWEDVQPLIEYYMDGALTRVDVYGREL